MWWILFYFLLALATYFDKISDTWAIITVICSIALGLFLTRQKRIAMPKEKVDWLSGLPNAQNKQQHIRND
jgi:hypothetical protein